MFHEEGQLCGTKSVLFKQAAERMYPYKVDVPVPPTGLGKRLTATFGWCPVARLATRAGNNTDTRSAHGSTFSQNEMLICSGKLGAEGSLSVYDLASRVVFLCYLSTEILAFRFELV